MERVRRRLYFTLRSLNVGFTSRSASSAPLMFCVGCARRLWMTRAARDPLCPPVRQEGSTHFDAVHGRPWRRGGGGGLFQEPDPVTGPLSLAFFRCSWSWPVGPDLFVPKPPRRTVEARPCSSLRCCWSFCGHSGLSWLGLEFCRGLLHVSVTVKTVCI